MNFYKNKYYRSWIKGSWPYVTGAILLSLFQIVTFATTEKPWGITEGLAKWGAWVYESFGGTVENWYYFSDAGGQVDLSAGFFHDPESIRNLGLILGALLATLLASQFRIKKIKSWKHVIAAILGGLMMGYGARIASGCSIGALYGGIASLSLSGWVFAFFLFLGAMVGSKLVMRYFI